MNKLTQKLKKQISNLDSIEERLELLKDKKYNFFYLSTNNVII